MVYYKYYHYDPSLAASVLFAILFGITTAWHMLQLAKSRSWYFIPVLLGGIFEIVGYAARAVSHSQAPELTLGPYVIETLLLLVAPPLVDGEKYSLIRKKFLAKSFVASDLICFFVQLGGAGLMSSSHATTAATGSHIVLAGLLVQILIFGFFVLVAAVFHRRMKAEPTAKVASIATLKNKTQWQKYLYLLYGTSALVLVRNVARVAEFIEGFEGFIILHEVFLYVFDAVPMLVVSFAFNFWYPGQFAGKPEAEDGVEMTS
ncbi:hypothetical protein LTR97_012876 [Elasticomyces elasticus]|uniref:RTA1 like protein n=1 Tax=Elasticomyces elasticus TaxID=574655 RepID=A0AAN7ZYC7_9PEZI|nr:hypothetical protein LTR97_012876 [Elasticomyces elasticus]